MKKLIFAFLSVPVIHFAAFAQDIGGARALAYQSLPTCGRALFSSDEFLAASISDDTVEVVSMKAPRVDFVIRTSGKIVDLKIREKTLYVLTEKHLEAYGLETQKNIFSYATYSPAPATEAQNASAFVLLQNQAIIAHGALGFSKIDLGSGDILKTLAMPTPSYAIDLDLIDSHNAVVVLDSDDGRNFRGLYNLNLDYFKVDHQTRVDNALPSAVRVHGANLLVVYFNSIWEFNLQQAMNSSHASPQLRRPNFPGVPMTDISGKIFVDEKNLYACFKMPRPKAFVFDLGSIGL